MGRSTRHQQDPERHAPSEFAERELSPFRVSAAGVVVAAIAVFFAFAFPRLNAQAAPPFKPAWFAPYVDETLPPPYQWQDRAWSPARDVILSFIVALPTDGCTPSWGGAFTLARASTALDVDRRVSRLREQGGDVIVSFGGAANQELAVVCPSIDRLEAAYGTVVRRYGVKTIDLDLENAALQDEASMLRRAVAIARLQRSIRKNHGHLAVWLTLPVAPQGMPAGALKAIDAMLRAQVDLAGVNVMTLDFGGSRVPGQSMLQATEAALSSSHAQLAQAYSQAGLHRSSREVWNLLGVTPMIGVNDVVTDKFELSDARALLAFVRKQSIARISMWSLNRDSQCSPNVGTQQEVANYCSGVAQPPLGFSSVFAKLDGRPPHANRAIALPQEKSVDNAVASPYPIWVGLGRYPRGWRVVWHGLVYEARRWTVDEEPNAPVAALVYAPWELVGPVLPDEHQPVLPRLAPGTYPKWDPTVTYGPGDRVLVDGLPYESKWSNANIAPDQPVPNPWDTPWTPLFTPPGAPAQAASS